MLAKDKLLKILICVLAVLVVVSAAVVYKGSHRPRVIYMTDGPEYDPEILNLGVQVSKFGGMAIYRDSPGALLARAEKLELNAEQQQRLEEIVQESRRQAVAVLTEEQRANVSPVAKDPFVVAKLTPTFVTCETCADGVCPTDDQDHDHEHAHAH